MNRPLTSKELDAAIKAEIAESEGRAETWAKPRNWIRGHVIARSEDLATVDFGPPHGTRQFNEAFLRGRTTIWVKPAHLRGRGLRIRPHAADPAPAPGLVGEIADWITATAMRPQPELALAAALVLVGTVAGRHIAGPTLSGTHLYIVGLAPTGSGKDHALKQIGTILAELKLTEKHLGPGEFISMPAVFGLLTEKPLSLCAMDEFGAFLKRVNSRKASGFEAAISKTLREVWGSSFKIYTTPRWANRPEASIYSPALSIYGVSTEGEFYDSLAGADITNGLLNRLLIINGRHRPERREPQADPFEVPASIVDGLKAIYNAHGEIVTGQLTQSDVRVPFVRLEFSPDAGFAYEEFHELIDDLTEDRPDESELRARAVEYAIRVATILAIGQGSKTIEESDFLFARDLVETSVLQMIKAASLHIADSESQEVANAIRRGIREGGGRVSHRDLTHRLKHRYKVRELKDAMESLVQAGDVIVEKEERSGGGHKTVHYRLPQ